MTDLVIMKDRQAVTSSLQVAESFDKKHQHVLRDVDALEKDVSNFGQMFVEGNEPDSYGRERRVIYMNRDGFTILAMGFTGKKALQFKLQYIEAFNRLEKEYQKQRLNLAQLSPVTQAIVGHDLKIQELENRMSDLEERYSEVRLDESYYEAQLEEKYAEHLYVHEELDSSTKETLYTTTDIATELGTSVKVLNRMLHEQRIIHPKRHGRDKRLMWHLYARQNAKGLKPEGSLSERQHWTEKGREFVIKLYRETKQVS